MLYSGSSRHHCKVPVSVGFGIMVKHWRCSMLKAHHFWFLGFFLGLAIANAEDKNMQVFKKVPKGEAKVVNSVELRKLINDEHGSRFLVVVRLDKGTQPEDSAYTADKVREMVVKRVGKSSLHTICDYTASEDGSIAWVTVGSIGVYDDPKSQSGSISYVGGDLPNLVKLEGLGSKEITGEFQAKPDEEELKKVHSLIKDLTGDEKKSFSFKLQEKKGNDKR